MKKNGTYRHRPGDFQSPLKYIFTQICTAGLFNFIKKEEKTINNF